jgi:hypothetical protein
MYCFADALAWVAVAKKNDIALSEDSTTNTAVKYGPGDTPSVGRTISCSQMILVCKLADHDARVTCVTLYGSGARPEDPTNLSKVCGCGLK